MLKPKEQRVHRYWENLTDDQLLKVDLTTDDPENLDNLVRELPPDFEDSYVEYKYDLRGSEREEFSCVHGHHKHLAGFVMRKGEKRWLVGHICAESIYGETFDQYKADFNSAVNRQVTLRKRREIDDAIAPFIGWLKQVSDSGLFNLYESVRSQVKERLPWIWENAPRAAALGASRGLVIPPTLFLEDTDPYAKFAKVMAEMSALAANLIAKEDIKEDSVRRLKRTLEGFIPRVENVLSELKEVEDFFQPAVLNEICDQANRFDNPGRRAYSAEFMAITCRRKRDVVAVRIPKKYLVPSRQGLEALREMLRLL
jgi:hypothetical protein